MELSLHFSIKFTEDNVKKAYISPVTSLLMSLSLALGILVSDLRGYRLLTSAHAQERSPCVAQEQGEPVTSDTVNIQDGVILNGLTVQNVNVNGSIIDQAVIADTVALSDATVVGPGSNGVLVGSGGNGPCRYGVLVGSGGPAPYGVLVGSGGPGLHGVLVGSGSPGSTPTLSGVTGTASGTAVGGILTGDNITITNGVLSGQNLLLSGATFNDSSTTGSITLVTLTPAN